MGLLLAKPRSRLIPQPTENYRLVRWATDGVFTIPRALTPQDVTDKAAQRMRYLVHQHLKGQGKSRFVMKFTGFPRVAYLNEIFPDALFIHVVRDGRAVASSLVRAPFWRGEASWGWGEMGEEFRKEYLDAGKNELILAAISWKMLMRHLVAACEHIPSGRFLQMRYDKLITNPLGRMREIAEFCQLPNSELFERRVTACPLISNDKKWRKLLTPEEQRQLEHSLRPALETYGFED
jgi:hypothetical protein